MSFKGRKNTAGLHKGLRVLDREHDIPVSTVEVLGASMVQNKDDLKNLIQNVLKRISLHRPAFLKEETSKDTMVYTFSNKRSALTLARSIRDAFKHYHPKLSVDQPEERSFAHIFVEFQKAE